LKGSVKVRKSRSAKTCMSPAPTTSISCEACSLVCWTRSQLRLEVEISATSIRATVEELGQEFSDKQTKEPVEEIIQRESDSPLFLMDTLDGQKGEAQDEKDKTVE